MTQSTVLPLLDDGRCSIRETCNQSPSEVHAQCPQAVKCGTCVAWSPREENRYGRNSGQCMLNRETTAYLDCNAQICPYYRPRRDNPAYDAWVKAPKSQPTNRSPRSRRTSMDREAPPPTPAALAMAAFADHPEDVAGLGATVLEGLLEASVSVGGPLPVLLERFRGGSARVHGSGESGTVDRTVTLEAFYARLVLVRRALDALEAAVDDAPLGDERTKIEKDLAGMGGALTTFNILFKNKSDQFRGQGKG